MPSNTYFYILYWPENWIQDKEIELKGQVEELNRDNK